MKKIIGLALAAVLMLSFAACTPSVTAPTSYSVIGCSEPIPAITEVVGSRSFEGSSTTLGADPEKGNLAITCSYTDVTDIEKDLQTYIKKMVDSYGFTETTPWNPEKPTDGAVLTKPSEVEGEVLTMTITVPDSTSYNIRLESIHVEAGIAGGSEDAALKASTVYKLNNNNRTLLAA